MLPVPDPAKPGTNGIARVVEAYYRYLPDYGVEFAPPQAGDFDLVAAHSRAHQGRREPAGRAAGAPQPWPALDCGLRLHVLPVPRQWGDRQRVAPRPRGDGALALGGRDVPA